MANPDSGRNPSLPSTTPVLIPLSTLRLTQKRREAVMKSIRPFSAAALTLVLALALGQSVLAATVSVKRGPYLQTGTPTSVTVRWRTDVQTDSCVRYGTSLSSLTGQTCASTSTTEHTVKLSSLSANTKYYYSIGTNAG